MASPFLYFVDDRLSLAELTAARLDGDVVELGEAFIPADAVETRGLRGGSLSSMLGDTLAATHLSAAWVHGAIPDPPSRHTVQRAVKRRLHRSPAHHLTYRDGAMDPADLNIIGGVYVTTPLRTLVDLCRVQDEPHARAARLLAEMDAGLAAAAISRLASGALPHKRAALALLHGMTAEQGQVTMT
jgi:hypothetical protein